MNGNTLRTTRPRKSRLTSVLSAGAAVIALAAPAGAESLTVETFTGGSVANPGAWVSGGSGGVFTGWPAGACLTAGTDTSQAPVPGCGLGAPDAAGSGALRLTPATTGRAGFALYNSALPTTGGLDISFLQSQWGGSGADGISFFLVDGSTNLVQPGATGGSLGYAPGGGAPGVTNGLIGVGLDLWGNFSTPGGAGSGCTDNGPGALPNVVTIRGPGSGFAGYCFLGTSGNLSSFGLSLQGTSRADGQLRVRIVFDPAGVGPRNVTVYLDGTPVLQVPAPSELLASTTFKFGFSAATGAVTNNHEVWDLTIESVVPVTPVEPPAPVPVAPTFTG